MNLRSKLIAPATCLLLLATSSLDVRGATIFSQTDSTGLGSSWSTHYDLWEPGDDFTLAQNAILESIEWSSPSTVAASTRFRLYETGTGNLPVLLPFYDVTVVSSPTGGSAPEGKYLRSLILPGAGVALTGGTRYWWTVQQTGVDWVGLQGYAHGDGGGTPDSLAQRQTNTSTWYDRNQDAYFVLNGTTSQVPEPTTLAALISMGGMGLIAARRRRKGA